MPTPGWLYREALPADAAARRYLAPDDLAQLLDQHQNWRGNVNGGGHTLTGLQTISCANLQATPQNAGGGEGGEISLHDPSGGGAWAIDNFNQSLRMFRGNVMLTATPTLQDGADWYNLHLAANLGLGVVPDPNGRLVVHTSSPSQYAANFVTWHDSPNQSTVVVTGANASQVNPFGILRVGAWNNSANHALFACVTNAFTRFTVFANGLIEGSAFMHMSGGFRAMDPYAEVNGAGWYGVGMTSNINLGAVGVNALQVAGWSGINFAVGQIANVLQLRYDGGILINTLPGPYGSNEAAVGAGLSVNRLYATTGNPRTIGIVY